MADEEPVDQKQYLEDFCKPKCVRPLRAYQAQMSPEMSEIEVDDATLWHPNVEKLFIHILVEEVNKHKMETLQLTPRVWKSLLDEMKKRSAKNFSMKQLKQKFNRLRIKHREFTTLLDQPGFEWDTESNKVTASKEIWQNYLRAHPFAKPFRKKGCEHYNLLGIIFNRSIATGRFHHSSTHDRPNKNDERELQKESLNTDCHVDVENMIHDDAEILTPEGSRSDRHRPSTTPVELPLKEVRSIQMAEVLIACAEASKTKLERYKSNTSGSTSALSDPFSVSVCMDALNALPDIEHATYLKALEKLHNPVWREMFINMPVDRKRAWMESL